MSEITHSVLLYQTSCSALYTEVSAYIHGLMDKFSKTVFLFNLTYFGHLLLSSVGTFISLHQMI